jgi:hypothetical protein
MREILEKIKADPRYVEGIKYGMPRPGHAEGTIANHLADLEKNLEKLRPFVSDDDYWKLQVLIHTHDTFKGWAIPNSPITDPNSHASLAKKFLSEFTDDVDLLKMVQFHDEGLALYLQWCALDDNRKPRHKYSRTRFVERILPIDDIELFLMFTIIDGYTPSKDHAKIRWFVDEVNEHHKKTPNVYSALELFGI